MSKKLTFVGLVICVLVMTTGYLSIADENLERNKYVARVTVHSTATGLGEILKDEENEQSRIELIRSFVDPVRFYQDNSGYFYVYNYDYVNIAHPTQPELVGQDLADYTDCKGKLVVRELAEAAKDGGGFIEYYWEKPGREGEYKKIGYVEPIPNTEYFIGTGVYISE